MLIPYKRGAAIYHSSLLNHLAKKTNIIVLTQAHKGKAIIERNKKLNIYRALPPNLLEAPIPVRWATLIILFPFVLFYLLAKYHPDVIHLHSSTPLTRISLILIRFLNIPVILDVRDEYFTDLPIKISNIQRYIAASRAISRKLQSYGIPKEKIVFHGVLNPPIVNEIANDLGRRKSKEKVHTRFIFVGALSKTKGVETLLEAFKQAYGQNSEIKLSMIGEGKMRPFCERFLLENNLGKNVEIIGELNYREVLRQIALSDVLILPSKSEGISRVVIESLELGTPVLASKIGGLNEVIEHRWNGILVHPPDKNNFAKWILELTENESLRSKLASNTKKSETNTLTWEEISASFREIYENS
ncbi:hypothetical protein AKJ47_02925 [candidate division MSBL1 archaeon SCGC-AAA261G05]|uniref:Glycosyl transferase family 1 domain-containing protein n=1 Tax=candidate division MSBL1 archaeon SCGC-AAA261G05 TaxID=1698276 RepID=A0A133V9E5_9EURY|nr:hypothetical protein AKJ47_02925 [candidate division MSBL1 archaeon SCGC-AAA261G05]